MFWEQDTVGISHQLPDSETYSHQYNIALTLRGMLLLVTPINWYYPKLYTNNYFKVNPFGFDKRWLTGEASGKRWSTENELWKRKYGNESTEVRRKAAYQCLMSYWLMTVPCSLRVTVFRQCESRTLIHQTPAITNTVISILLPPTLCL